MITRLLPLALVTIAMSALFAGCAAVQPAHDAEPVAGVVLGDALAEAGFDGSDPRAVVNSLDALALDERPEGLIVSVMPDELIVQPEQPGERRISLSEESFYLSVAPYVSQTHPCTFHSLTTCVGEQRNQAVQVRVVDSGTGEVYLDEARTTFDNGFTGLWLPRDKHVTVTMAMGNQVGSVSTSTGAGDPTCLTTLRLA